MGKGKAHLWRTLDDAGTNKWFKLAAQAVAIIVAASWSTIWAAIFG